MTARDFAQTLELCERFGIEHTAIGRHRGGRLAAKARRAAVALGGAARAGRAARRFDVALGHGSNDVTVAAALLRDPVRDGVRLRVGDASSTRSTAGWRRPSSCPTRSRPSGSRRYGATPASCSRYPGLKEEYYLADFEPDPAVLGELGLDRARAARRRAHAARGLALPPLREPAVRAGARAAARARRSSCCRARPSSAPSSRAAGGFIVPRARDRRAVAGRLRRPRDLRRRHDEPRGGRARHAGVDDVRGPARARSTSA